MINQQRQRGRASAMEVGRSSAARYVSAATDGALRASDVPRVVAPSGRCRRSSAASSDWIRRSAIGIGVAAALVAAGFLALWWRLASGPIQLDVVTPWLASAIEENFGSSHHVEVGGTQIERTENGGTAVRIRDIVVRDADGTVVASAPKAEVRVSGMSLLSGHMRAESLNLVGAEMAVRIEQDGGVTVFAGADKRPIATASVPVSAAALLRAAQETARRRANGSHGFNSRAVALATAVDGAAPAPPRQARDVFAALLSWIDGIGETGLDGHDLRELGLKNGNLTVDDERTGKHWTLPGYQPQRRARARRRRSRPSAPTIRRGRGLVAAWSRRPARASAKFELEARRVSASDLLLAARLDDGNVRIDTPLSASIERRDRPGRVAADARRPHRCRRRLDRAMPTTTTAASPSIAPSSSSIGTPATRLLSVPFQILSGGDRITLMGQIEAPQEAGGIWSFKIGGGTIVLTARRRGQRSALVLNRIAVSGRYDAGKQRFVVDEGDIGNTSVGVAMSGNMDFSRRRRALDGRLCRHAHAGRIR